MAAFEKVLVKLPLEEYRVLVYYGVGGIGKTSLLNELCRLLQEQHPQVAWAVLDLATPTHRNVETALSWLRQELNRKYKVHFPSFDLALAQFWQKSRPQTPLRIKDLPLLEEGSLLADLVSIAGDIPAVELIPKVPILILKTHNVFRDWWIKRGQRELYALQDMAPGEIAARLPMFWAADLKDFMQRKSRPIILFVDTYEALWEGRRTEGLFFSQDEWVRELVAQLPSVPWIIAGREKLRWAELDTDWKNYQEQHLIGQLAEKDVQTFLASCGVIEEAVQRSIVQGSKGVPFYLDLAVDTYLEINAGKQRSAHPSDFEGTPRDVLERFLRYLDRTETETLKVLSVPRFWDRMLFELLTEKFKTGYPVTALPELCRFSFVQEAQYPNTWTIHPLMREGLEEHQDIELRGQVHHYLFDHYDRLLRGLDGRNVNDSHIMALTEAFYHGQHALSIEELSTWFAETAEIFDRAARWKSLVSLYEELAALVDSRLGSEHSDTALILHNLAGLYVELGRYKEAEPLSRRALKIREKTLGLDHLDTGRSLSKLGVICVTQGRYGEAESLYKRTLEIRRKTLGQDHPDTADILNNLAELYVECRQYEAAALASEQTLAIREKALGLEHPDTAAGLGNLASIRSAQRRYEEAEQLCQRALAIYGKVLRSEHPDEAIVLNNLANARFRQGRHEHIEELYERALATQEGALGSEHPNNANILNNLAWLCTTQGRYEEAESLYGRALQIREKALGYGHRLTVRTRTAIKDLQEKRKY